MSSEVRTVEIFRAGWRFNGEPMSADSGTRGAALVEVLQESVRSSRPARLETIDAESYARSISSSGSCSVRDSESDAAAFATSLLSQGPALVPRVQPRRGARRAAAPQSSWSSAPSLDFHGVADISESEQFAKAISR